VNITQAIIETFGIEQLRRYAPLSKQQVIALLKAHAPKLYASRKWGSLQLITNRLNERLAV
jgi:hypothetical protein